MREGPPAIHALARQVLAHEAAAEEPREPALVAIRVCQRLFACMGRLVGPVGFQVLITRALSRASARHPLLRPVQVKVEADLSFDGLRESAGAHDAEVATSAGETLVAEFVGLIARFLGADLLLHFVQQCWPDLPVAHLAAELEEKSDA